MTFEQIPGNAAVKEQLKSVVASGKVPHAYLFCGQQGVFKYETALAFARLLTGNSEPDIIEITNERYSINKKTLSVDAIRGARQDIFTKPYMSDKKVFIINNAQDLNTECQNALLKVFEEPPEYCVIILVTNNETALLPTIRSRGVAIRFSAVSESEVQNYLQSKGLKADSIIIKLAGGSIKTACDIASSEEKAELVQNLIPLARKLNKPSYKDLYDLIAFFQPFEKEPHMWGLALRVLSVMFRETLLKNVEMCDTIAFGDVSAHHAGRVIEKIESTAVALKANGNYNAAISELFLNIPEIYGGL